MIRDPNSNALIETDVNELQKYRKEKARDREIRELRNDIKELKEHINILNDLIRKIEARS